MGKKIICIISALCMVTLLVGCINDDNEVKVIHEIHTESTENQKTENTQGDRVVDNRVSTPQTVYVERTSYDYIIPDSNTRYLTRAELSAYTVDELSYIRNEIFARHGYVFNMTKYATYFSGKSWYVPDYSYSGSYSALNRVEIANVELLKDMEGID